jgi:hypothetical protein
LAFVRSYAAQQLPFSADFVIDGRVAMFVVGMTAVATFLVAVLPMLHGTHRRLAERLRGGSSSSAAGAAGRRARGAFVSLQLALTIAVLIGAGLLVQSVRRVASVELGYDPGGLISFAIAPPHRYDAPGEAAGLYKRILDATRAVPGVQLTAAAGGALLPTKVETDDQRGAATPPTASYHPISSDFLGTIRARIIAGRGFTEDDMRSPTDFSSRKIWRSICGHHRARSTNASRCFDLRRRELISASQSRCLSSVLSPTITSSGAMPSLRNRYSCRTRSRCGRG